MITVEEAAVSHIPAIRQVLCETWQDTYKSILSSTTIDKVTTEWHSADVLNREIECDSTYSGIAKSNTRVIGMITVNKNGDLLFISRLYVLPAFQRQGVGTLLLNSSFSAFPRAKRVRLEVEEKNRVGVVFYRKHDFNVIKRIEEKVFDMSLQSIVMEREI